MNPLLFEQFEIRYKILTGQWYDICERFGKFNSSPPQSLEQFIEQWFTNWTLNIDKDDVDLYHLFAEDVKSGMVTIDHDSYCYHYHLTEFGRDYFKFRVML